MEKILIFAFLAILLSSSSAKAVVNEIFMGIENSIVLLDLPPDSKEDKNSFEWIIETEQDRILLITLSTTDGSQLKEDELKYLTVYDNRDLKNINLFNPSSKSSSSLYSTGNSVVIKYQLGIKTNPSPIQLKIEKAADCPVNIGGFSSCGRITDQVSCYCATFTNRTWDQTRLFCNQNGMRFVAIESYDEDQAIWNAWGGQQGAFWIGLSDLAQEDKFVWEATGGLLSAGYKNWQLGEPNNGASGNENCAHIGQNDRPGWNDINCDRSFIYSDTVPLGGICELQP